MIQEVIYVRPDGITVKTVAWYSYRRGPIGEWFIGDKPLADLDGKIVSTHLR